MEIYYSHPKSFVLVPHGKEKDSELLKVKNKLTNKVKKKKKKKKKKDGGQKKKKKYTADGQKRRSSFSLLVILNPVLVRHQYKTFGVTVLGTSEFYKHRSLNKIKIVLYY